MKTCCGLQTHYWSFLSGTNRHTYWLYILYIRLCFFIVLFFLFLDTSTVYSAATNECNRRLLVGCLKIGVLITIHRVQKSQLSVTTIIEISQFSYCTHFTINSIHLIMRLIQNMCTCLKITPMQKCQLIMFISGDNFTWVYYTISLMLYFELTTRIITAKLLTCCSIS